MTTPPLSELVPFGAETRPTRVLLVDDDEEAVQTSAAFLRRELDSAETTALTDSTEVLEALRHEEFDCLVSDFDMPGTTGLELLHEIREAGIETPFVLFTGKGSEEVASQAITAGVDEYLQKGGPEVYPVLANMVENLAEKHRAETLVQRAFLAIESAEEAIGIVDENGVYRYLNEAYAAVYDHTRAELIGRHWDVLYDESEARRFHDEILPELERRGTWRGISTGLTKEGAPVPERLVLTRMDDGGHVCIVRELARDGELEAELALKTRALDAAHLGVVVTDATAEDNPIVWINEGFENLTGYGRRETLGRNCRFLQGEATDPETVAEIRRAIGSEEAISTDLLNYDASGDPFWNRLHVFPIEDGHGSVTHFVGFQEDVTEQKRNERLLRASTMRLEALFEHSPDMIAIHDADGTIRDVNERICEELGYTESELVGRAVWEIDATADSERARQFWAALPTNTPRRFEGALERRDGTTVAVEVHLIRLELDGEDRFVAMDRDIGDRKAREAALVEQNERLDKFASVVSHDLRNPLQVAQGRLQLLEEDYESEHIPHISRALDRMEALIADLLALAHGGEAAMELERIQLSSLARACWETVETADATLVVDADGHVEADRDQLRQLFENLFRNAVEHGSAGSRPASDDDVEHGSNDGSEAADDDADPVTVRVGRTPTGFFVADDGPGIPEAMREEVFEAGYSTAAEGTGFGLNIVEQVTEAHGWRIDVVESDSGGARFEITVAADGTSDAPE
ncbi:PAS domain S-box protein [Haloprofundus sp. MHR1]|uniref:PAS domain S-box protein n=1 Tax=Haloprofundus sp. MHR1 TaxID=2572921 RepID=UPI0010BF06FE|nr:PAS domain S-box protein [Haloprofundus sp. MHR1]QCJ45645.1 PAS domain S-box protein [Haloprofundus sp. MHR1]